MTMDPRIIDTLGLDTFLTNRLSQLASNQITLILTGHHFCRHASCNYYRPLFDLLPDDPYTSLRIHYDYAKIS